MHYTLHHEAHGASDQYRFIEAPDDGPASTTTLVVTHPVHNIETAHLLRTTAGVIGPTKYGLDIDEPIPVCVARLLVQNWSALSHTTVPLPEGNRL